jgi:hypothetical protein
MRHHLAVAVFPGPDRPSIAAPEEAVVCRLDPALSHRHCLPSPIRVTLKGLRASLTAP